MTRRAAKTYTAVCEREQRWWVVRVPELDLVTQARRLEQVEAMARDLIATWLDVDPNSFTVNFETRIPLDIAACHFETSAGSSACLFNGPANSSAAADFGRAPCPVRAPPDRVVRNLIALTILIAH